MIDTNQETLLSIPQAAKRIPGRSGHGIGVATLWRWMTHGVRGTVLDSILIGGIRYTSAEAIERFAVAQNGPRVRAYNVRQAAMERAERQLQEAGI